MKPSALATEDWKSIASWLLHGNVDEGVSQVLGLLGSRHGSDRAWVIRYDDDFTHLWNTHEWTAPGVASFVAELQGIPVEAGTWVHEGMQRDGRVLVADVARTLRTAAPGSDPANLGALLEAQVAGSDRLELAVLRIGQTQTEVLRSLLSELRHLTAQNEAILARAST